MKASTKQSQVKTIRAVQQRLRVYINRKTQDKKDRVFTAQEIKNTIFHLQTISTITDERKIAQKASKLEKLFWKILIYELNGGPKISKNQGNVNGKRARPREAEPEI
jgi:hypothetical protein